MAGQRAAIVTGLKDSVKEFSDRVPGVQSRDVMELVLTTQYMDALREVCTHDQIRILTVAA